MKQVILVLATILTLGLFMAPAQAYNGVSVTIPMQLGPHSEQSDGVAMVRVFNHTSYPVQCRVHFFPKFVGPPHNWLRVFNPGVTNLWATDLRDKNYAALVFCSGQANANNYTFLSDRYDDVWHPLVKEKHFTCVNGKADFSTGYWNYLSDSETKFWLTVDGKTFDRQTVGAHTGTHGNVTGLNAGAAVTVNAKSPTGELFQRTVMAPDCEEV